MSLDYMMSNSQNQEKNAQWLFMRACAQAKLNNYLITKPYEKTV